MSAENQLPQRSRPVHGVHVSLSEPTIVWLTVCARDRAPWIASEEVHQWLVSVWREAMAWRVGRYILMPDHVHLFCAPHDLAITLDTWVKYWKSMFSKSIPNKTYKWQAGHWDTRLRRHESYTDKWRYCAQNPVRAGLVSREEDWPYQGELFELRW